MFSQGQGTEEGGGNTQGMDGRADVVPKPRQREFGSAGATANSVAGLEDEYSMAGARQGDGRGQTIGSRANDDSVVGALCGHSYL